MPNFKHIIFRADGNKSTGLGHLFRILALAEVCENDFSVTVLTRESSHVDVFPNYLNVKFIPDNISSIDEPSWISHFFSSKDYLIVLDGYHFGLDYQKSLKEIGYKLVYIDDLHSFHQYADVVINHSPHINKDMYEAEVYTQFALGTKYSLVRKKFIEACSVNKQIASISTVFVCFGGSDSNDFTHLVCNYLNKVNSIKQVYAIVGNAYDGKKLYELNPNSNKIIIKKNLSELDLIQTMNLCQLAVVPTSTIFFELCCVQIPILACYYVDNQKSAYEAFVNEGLAVGLGNMNNINEVLFTEKLNSIINSNTKSMLNNQKRLFDGKQHERIINLFNNL